MVMQYDQIKRASKFIFPDELDKFDVEVTGQDTNETILRSALLGVKIPSGSSDILYIVPHKDSYAILDENDNLTPMIAISDTENVLSIGRGDDNDIQLSDVHVSRNHLYIEHTDNMLRIDDRSSNGTTVFYESPYL
jgi:hypothetical protein